MAVVVSEVPRGRPGGVVLHFPMSERFDPCLHLKLLSVSDGLLQEVLVDLHQADSRSATFAFSRFQFLFAAGSKRRL